MKFLQAEDEQHKKNIFQVFQLKQEQDRLAFFIVGNTRDNKTR